MSLTKRLAIVIAVLLWTSGLLLAQEKPFAFAVIGDSGCGCSEQRDVAEQMYSWFKVSPFYTVIMLGDNIYSGPQGSGGSPRLFDDRFDNMYKTLLDKGVKFYATLGNHDLETSNGGYEIADKKRFHISQDTGYYAVHSAQQVDGRPLIEFFCINSNRLLALNHDPAQIAWLSKALTDSKAVWKIAFFHHPIYAPEGGHEPELGLREGIEKILTAAGAQIVLSGHDHYYARMKPQNGLIQFISGGGGRSLKSPRATDQTGKTLRANHFMYFEVFPDRIQFWAVAAAGETFDKGTIYLDKTSQAAVKK